MSGNLKMPTSVIIALTGRCNLSCKYCYYADEMVALSDLPLAIWLKFFEELRDEGIMRVTLSGGEPFARPDFWEILEGVIHNKMRFSLLTNGTLITEKAAGLLDKYRKRLDYVQISLDGSSPETHDLIRGKGSFNRTLRGIEFLKKYNLPWTVRVTINKLNVYDLDAILFFLHDKMGLKSFDVNEAFPRGAGQCNNSTLEMTPDERRLSFRVMQSFDREHPGVASGAQAGPLITANRIDVIRNQLGESRSLPQQGFMTGCNIMWQKISVLHDGTYVPCHQLPQIALGKVGQDKLRDVWLNAPGLLSLRQRHAIPLETDPRCKGCQYIDYCTGGCPGVAYAFTGDINTSNPLDCYRAYIGEDPTYVF